MTASSNPRTRLRHILFHIEGVEQTTAGATFASFTGAYHMERTVERAVEIISEAAKNLPPELLSRYSEVEWPKIILSATFCATNINESIRP